MLTINDEEVELRDLDDEADLQSAESLNIAPVSDVEEPVVDSFE